MSTLKGCCKLGEVYNYFNPITGEGEIRFEHEKYSDEEKCKLCKYTFERREG